MKAIQTRYNGCYFRSRLEARYAVFFDSLEIKWDYEPEGFELPDGRRYLPDFWLHAPNREGSGYWVEIKPIRPTADEFDRLKRVSVSSGHRAWFLIGTPAEDSRVIAVESGLFSAFTGCAPVVVCAGGASYTPERMARAISAARSARFEFGDRA
jgi:hypothetical protein